MDMRDRLDSLHIAKHKTSILLGVMALNFLLTGIDVLMAHSQNAVFRFEIIPLLYTPCAVLAVLGRISFHPNRWVGRAFQAVMWCGFAVGVVGTYMHLAGNATSSAVSLHRLLVAGSPIAAPIAFAGIASYAIASDRHRGALRRSKLLVLVGLGFLGASTAAFFDHARLGFVPSQTLIPLVAGTLATASCFYLASVRPNRRETYICLFVLALNILVGMLGFAFHLLGDLAGTPTMVWARILYRAPLLGPLLFCNLGMLGGLAMLPESDDAIRAESPAELVAAG